MDTFLYETNYLIYAMHIFYQLPFEAELIKEKERILLKSKNLPDVCEISFWKNNVIEIVIEQAKDMIYYLHFEFLTFQGAKSIFDDFFIYCKERYIDKKYEVLICCSGGFTSTLFAEGVKEEARRRKSQVIISSGCYNHMQWQEVEKQYDLVLLAPQIAYLLSNHKNCPWIKAIPTNLYATYNYRKVLDLIDQQINVTN